MSAVGDLRTLMRFPDFRRLLAVRLLSQLADGIYQVALAAYVVFSPENETSPAAIASAMAVLLLPYSLLGPFAGVLLDRWRRRQVLLYGNLLRAVLAAGTAALILGAVPAWLFYLSALSVTAVNRFILAGLSAALPRVVDDARLVMANSLSPTAGTLAATAGGGIAFAIRLAFPDGGRGANAWVVVAGAAVYLLAGAAALRMGRDRLGPDPGTPRERLRLLTTLTTTTRGLADGLRHLRQRHTAAYALTAMTLMRFCYGALTVMVLMLCRYAWGTNGKVGDAVEVDVGAGLKLLGLAVAASGLGYFAAAVITPWGVGRAGRFGWLAVCAAAAAVLEPPLGLSFAPLPILLAAFVLGLVTQGSKITADTAVQSTVDDTYRGRVFSLYDMLFNVAFVGAAGVAALILPPDGRSVVLVLGVAVVYAGVAWLMFHVKRTQADRSALTSQAPPSSPPGAL
ncbi:MFS transporter [Streptomyces abyssalis]|uniref:MFS transporter n=1 Tax=Streptomyces abyssalis TaxID=933944 RepID=A0A1E7JPQ8_9ACTN|nr:MFS transporter [Streptomyces abyssalis]OEU90271.1 MFS transporter [Streptomyces abyssalis]OEU95006.1 MFS transporter [Streptomyces abyssalis]OEV27131.1 MFS transporter [Streptomyces nanshensis]